MMPGSSCRSSTGTILAISDEKVNSSNYTTFNGFTLERSINGTDWEEVSDVSVALTAETGAYMVQVPVYQVTVNEDTDEVTKTPYQYRFREVLPEGWHPANDADEETENGVRWLTLATLNWTEKKEPARRQITTFRQIRL